MSQLLKITLIGLVCFGFSACKDDVPQQASRDTGSTTVDMGLASIRDHQAVKTRPKSGMSEASAMRVVR